MLGSFRLFLAALVVITHSSDNFDNKFFVGVVAVTVFYMISGYAMTGLIQKRFTNIKSAPTFLLERFVRLAPQYYFWLVISLFGWFYLQSPFFENDNVKEFINSLYPYGLISYITVIPKAFQAWFPFKWQVMGQIGTLAIEITLYLLSPWILKSRKMSWLAAFISIFIFIATVFEYLPENAYTYGSTLGPMIFYIMGSFLYRKDWFSLSFFTTVMIILLLINLPQRYNIEFLVAIIFGLTALMSLIQLPTNKFDSAMGDASYGCFLCHGVIIDIMTHYLAQNTTPLHMIFFIIFSCLAGYLSFYFIERPTISFRRKLQYKSNL